MRISYQDVHWDIEAPGLSQQNKNLKDKNCVTKSDPGHHF